MHTDLEPYSVFPGMALVCRVACARYDQNMNWLHLILTIAPIAYFGYEFLAFVRDHDRRDERSRRPPDAS